MNKTNSLFSRVTLLPWLLILAGLLLAFSRPLYSKLTPATLDIKIQEANAVMPAVYKVYGNEEALEGKYNLFRMVIKNTSGHAAENVVVKYEMPGFIKETILKKIKYILPGQTVVVNCYPKFEQAIVEKTTTSMESVNLKVDGSNIKQIENNFNIRVKGRNEFIYSFIPDEERRTGYDLFDNAALLACYVTPEDPIVKYYTAQMAEKVLKGETAAWGGGPEEAKRYLMGIYESMRLGHFVYSGDSGVPEKLGDLNTMTQSLKLPREVLTGKTGLCIELSLVYASILMSAGLDPIIYLVPGHAYPGINFNGNLYAIESTGIGGEGMNSIMTAPEAFESGMKKLREYDQATRMGDSRYMYIDIKKAINAGAIAMELKDDNYLRQKIDEIAKSFSSGGVPQQINTGNTVEASNNNGGGNDGGNQGGGNEVAPVQNTTVPNGYKTYSGVINFAYPGNWKKYPKTAGSLDEHIVSYGTSDYKNDVEVYFYPGMTSADQAMQTLQQNVQQKGAQLGLSMEYQKGSQSGAYTIYQGVTSNSQLSYQWIGAFKNTGNGIAAVCVGAMNGSNLQKYATNIFNTLQ